MSFILNLFTVNNACPYRVNRVEIALESNRQDKTLNCGQTVWGLAFGPRPSKTPAPGEKAASCERESSRLLLATGLDNGVIKIWDVVTGGISNLGHCSISFIDYMMPSL